MSTFLRPDGRPRAFVILSSARSGSNLLVRYLRQVKPAACFGEIFRESFVGTEGWHRLIDRLDLPDDAAAMHADRLTDLWDLVLERALRRREWAGAKAFYYHRRDDPVWRRFLDPDHQIIHLWRDSTFDQHVSRLLAGETGEWKGDGASSPEPDPEVRVTFDRDAYLAYRETMRADVEAARRTYGRTGRYVEVEYRQLSDHAHVEGLIGSLFGARIDVAEALRKQHHRPKIEYLTNPEAAAPFVSDSLTRGFLAPDQ